MSDEMDLPAANFSDVEERLQAEARPLLTAEHGLPASRLAALYRRRQRRRRVAQAAASATVLMIVVAIRLGGGHVEMAQAPRIDERAVAAKLERSTAAPNRPATEALGPSWRLTGGDQPDEGALAIPFVIGDPATGEAVISGIYVPEQVEPIDLRNLSPAERDAVRAVLGIEGEDTDVIQPI